MTPLVDRIKLVTAIVADKRCHRIHLAMAHLLLFRFYNGETGRCDPSVGTLAKAAATDRRYAQQALHELETWGYLRIEIGGGALGRFGSTNAYTPGAVALGACPDARGEVVSQDATLAFPRQYPRSQDATEQSNEQRSKSEVAIPHPDFFGGKRDIKASKKTPRAPKLFKAEAGCTIDSYQPDPDAMGAWAAEHAPLVPDPVAPGTVDSIKDVWRQRGEKPRDFDATYKNYLRKRQEWAAQARTRDTRLNGAGAPKSKAAI